MIGGPVIVGYDGSDASEGVIAAVAALFPDAPTLVVAVWEPSRTWDALALASITPAPIDVRLVEEADAALYEDAQRLAQRGAAQAAEAGLAAEGLAVADELSVAETLVRLARERGARALAVGSHGHRGIREVLLGSTTQDVVRHAECPVLVVRAPE